MREKLPQGTSSWWAKALKVAFDAFEGLCYFVLVVVLLSFIFIPPSVAWQGRGVCRANIREHAPALAEFVLEGGLWTRTFDAHWIVALVATPNDLTSAEVYTVICHFESTNHRFDRVEVLNGDQTDRIRDRSKNAANPFRRFLGEGL